MIWEPICSSTVGQLSSVYWTLSIVMPLLLPVELIATILETPRSDSTAAGLMVACCPSSVVSVRGAAVERATLSTLAEVSKAKLAAPGVSRWVL